MPAGPSRPWWRRPVTVIEIVASLAVVVAVGWIVLHSGALDARNTVPAATASEPSAGPDSQPGSAAGSPQAEPTAAGGYRTCLAFEVGDPYCVDGLRWSAHTCWAQSRGARLQILGSNGQWRNLQPAEVVQDSRICTEDYPDETSTTVTESGIGSWTYRFYNNSTQAHAPTPADAFTVTVTQQ